MWQQRHQENVYSVPFLRDGIWNILFFIFLIYLNWVFPQKNYNADLFLMLTSYKEDIKILLGGLWSVRRACFDFFQRRGESRWWQAHSSRAWSETCPVGLSRASLMALEVKSPPAMREAWWGQGSIPGSGRSSGGRQGNPLQYSCLENPTDRGAWWATVQGIAKSWTRLKRLSTHARSSPPA